MNQNRNKLTQLLIGNRVNVIVHRVLEEAVRDDILRNHYDKESLVSFEVARRYREKINPVQRELPEKDREEIKGEVLRRVIKELEIRIAKGYEGIDLSLVEGVLEEVLKELKVVEHG